MKKSYYLDSSALVKAYIRETETNFVLALLKENLLFYTASITYAEIYAAFYKVHRMGKISENNVSDISLFFEQDWSVFNVVDYHSEVRFKTPAVLKRFPLSGADGIHLVSATSLMERDIDLHFVSFDKRLVNAARDYGLKVIDPSGN